MTETTPMRVTAPTKPGAAITNGALRMIKADAQPATPEARAYFQRAKIIGTSPNWIGFPAYESAGKVRIQKEAAQATATPAGPQGRPKMNSRNVAQNSITPQRSQRSGLPIDKWIHACVPYKSMIPMPGPKKVNIRPAISQPGPKSTRIRSFPTRVRSAPNPIPTNARAENAVRK